MSRIFITIVCALTLPLAASAQDVSSSVTTFDEMKFPKFDSLDFSANFGIGTAQVTDAANATGNRFENRSGYRWYSLTPKVSHMRSAVEFEGFLSYSQSWASGESSGVESSLDNPSARLSKSWNSVSILDRVSIGAVGSTAANKASDDITFQGSVGGFGEVSKELGRFTLTQALAYSNASYGSARLPETETSPEVATIPHVFRSTSTVEYGVLDSLTASASFFAFQTRASDGAANSREQWLVSVGYEFNKLISTSVGFGTGVGAGSADPQIDQLGAATPLEEQAYLELVLSI